MLDDRREVYERKGRSRDIEVEDENNVKVKK
jgi:hypothetical protein